MKKTNFTKHAIDDRMNRMVFIGTTIGFGNIIDEFPVQNDNGWHLECVTDTGVIIVKSIDCSTIITMYIACYAQIVKLYQKKENIPFGLIPVVKSNEKRQLMKKSEMV